MKVCGLSRLSTELLSEVFVVPRPLSENLPLFEDWTRKLTRAMHCSWISRRALQVYTSSLNNGAVWEMWLQILEDTERQQALDRRAETMNLGFVSVQRRGKIRPTVRTKEQRIASVAEKKPSPVQNKKSENSAAAEKLSKKQATPVKNGKAAKKRREIKKMALNDYRNMTIEQLASRAEITSGNMKSKKQKHRSDRAKPNGFDTKHDSNNTGLKYALAGCREHPSSDRFTGNVTTPLLSALGCDSQIDVVAESVFNHNRTSAIWV